MKKNSEPVKGDNWQEQCSKDTDTEQIQKALQDALFQIEQLQKENTLLQANCSANEHQISRLSGLPGELQRLEYESSAKDRIIADLKHREILLQQTIQGINALMLQQSGNLSFRAARFLQMLNNPRLAGEKSKISFLLKYFISKLRGKKYQPDYHAFQIITKLLSANLEQLAFISADTAETAASDAPDSSLLISIVLPVYNQANLVRESIESVLAQTYSNWEMIIVDDCSTDNSYQIATEYAKKDSRIIVLQNEKNSGAAISRNKAIETAKGDYLAFLDSDDLWMPEKLEKQLNFMQENNCDFSLFISKDTISHAGTKNLLRLRKFSC